MTIVEVSPPAFLLALAAGAVSFLSPCVLPLIPGYLSFVSGVSFDELHANTRRVALRTAAFVAGFSLIFTLSGAGAGYVGSVLVRNQRYMEIGAGFLLIILGIMITGILKADFLERERRALPFRTPKGILGAFLVGMAFSIGWTPCVGPILASIYTLAASGGSAGGGALLLFVYSLGLGVPFLLAGVFFVRALGAFAWIKRHFRAIRIASGILLIVYGLLMISGEFTWLTARLAGFQLIEF